MVVYDVTELFGNVTSIQGLVSVVNDASSGLLVGLFVLALWIILFVSYIRFDFIRAFVGSSFVCLIISGFLVYLDWLNIIFMLAFLLFTAGGGLLLYLEH